MKNKTYNKKKMLVVFSIAVVLIVSLMARLFYLMVFDAEHYQKLAKDLHERERKIKAARGEILDRNGVVLAANKTVCTISVIHSQVTEPEKVARILAEELEMDESKIAEKIQKVTSMEKIRTNVEKETGDRIRDYDLDGVKVDEDFKRYYPYRDLASRVLGFTGGDNQGIIGLEVKYEEYLKGINGTILTVTDARGIELEGVAEDRIEPVAGGNLRISMDYNIQSFCQQAAEKVLEEKQADSVSVLLMNPQNGEILAMVNVPEFNLNTPYELNTEVAEEPLSDVELQERLNRMWRNECINDTYEPGSTFKIIAAYAPALDAGGLTLASVQDDAPYNYGSGQGGAVNNYDNRYRGFTTLREAITNSINIVTVKTLAQIGPSLGYDYICDFGITTVGLDESSNETLALGGLTHGVTNLELTAAYATIANSGTYIKPKFYTKILDHDGNVLIDNTEPVSHTVLKDTTAWLLTDAMKDVMTQGTGTPAYFGSSMAQAGKSGTTTKNRDALFAGFTPYYTCVVWGGFDDNSPQSGGQTTYPKKIWKAVMSRIHENLEYQDFTKPSGIVTAQVCKESGKLAIAGVCDADPRGSQVYTEYFAEGTQPTEYCDHHIVANICNASGQLAGGYCPADSISSRVFVIGGTVGTEDTPYLLTDDFKNNTCTMHNEGNSTYQGTSAFSAVPGV